MRIPCPLCGPRELREFVYRGDASVTRPKTDDPDAAAAFNKYVYLRDNIAGFMHEYWYHAAGCHAWLIVTRSTLTHEITEAVLAESTADPSSRSGASA
ncbi:MAG: methylglutamate dehydrogenase subunit [Alphaproteobacteria bacterium]|jgi:sarcosine oxidase subunit delta|nr:methylglutamate dehydrogenase subunit [Alphaproteobacteria bacterium]